MSLSLSLSALGNVRTETLRAFSAADMTKDHRQDALTLKPARAHRPAPSQA
ncbi:hypothetical protein ABID59_006503 [Bradyrhizobium sp. S3.3.6]